MRRGGEGWAVGPGPEGGGGSVDFTLSDFVLPPLATPLLPPCPLDLLSSCSSLTKSRAPTVGLCPWGPLLASAPEAHRANLSLFDFLFECNSSEKLPP